MADAPYFVEIGADDADNFSVSASLGALYPARKARVRPFRVNVRVGGKDFDNTNSIYSEYYPGQRYDPPQLPQENSVIAMRNALWLALDRSYKTAVEAIGRKKAALRGVSVTDPLPDFWAPPRLVLFEDARRATVDERLWTERVRALSAVFGAYPGITSSIVEFDHAGGVIYSVNSLGSVIRVPDVMTMLRIRAARQAADGATVYDGVFMAARDATSMPPEAELRKVAESVAKNVEAMAAAPVGEAYAGPVLFEPEAAAQLFAEVFGSQLMAARKPVSEPGRPLPLPASELESRLNSRVLPEWLDVVDDASLKEWKGQSLAGHYVVDYEGVQPRRLTLVEKGILKTLYTTLQPVKGVDGPNGHARLPGRLGLSAARLGNLIVQARESKPLAGLRAQLLEMVKQQNKPHGFIIRRMDYPSAGSLDDLRRLSQRAGRNGGGRFVSQPLLVYKVTPDGKEQLVRGLSFRGLGTRNFRDILAASSEEAVFNYGDNGLPMAMMRTGSYFAGCSVVAPGLLFEDLELEAGQEDLPKLPVAPPPALTAAGAR